MTNIQKAKNIGKSWGKGFFNDFYNHPEYRGPNFKWENFLDMTKKHSRVNCFLYFPYNTKNMKNIEKI